jgi:ABC-2 type transport system ATP-binding protein
MKQRLGIAQALLNEPRLLICDEPTSALDPIGRKEILDILLQVKGKTTVIFSTHILSDVERVCDHIAVLHNGKLALFGSLSDIREQHKSDSLLIEFSSSAEKEQFISSRKITPYLNTAEHKDTGIVLRTGSIEQAESAVITTLAEEKLLPLRLEVLEPTLESLFLEVVK